VPLLYEQCLRSGATGGLPTSGFAAQRDGLTGGRRTSAERNYDAVVIGGGVVGLSIARRLVADGRRVVLLERGACGGEASWAGAGIVAPRGPHRIDALFHLQERSLDLYPSFCAELHQETGIDPEYDRCGELELIFTEDLLRIAESDARAAAGRRMPSGEPVYRLLTAEEARQLEPAASEQIIGALQCQRTAQVRNPRLLAALVGSCRSRGVMIHEERPAIDLLIEENRVRGVFSKDGVVRAAHVILAAGAWSAQISDRLQGVLAVHPVRGQMILLKTDRRPFQRVLARGRTYLVPRRDGHVLLGSTEEPEAGFSKRVTASGIAGLIERGLKLAPSLADASVEATWAGLRPGTPDDKPLLGPVPGFDGLVAATGHFRAGLTLAPVTAELVARILAAEPYDLDLSSCDPMRLSG